MHIYKYMCICMCIYIISWCVQHFDTKHRILCARALARPIQRRFRGGHRDGMQWPWRPAVMETWLYLSPSPSPGVWSPGVWDRWIHLSSYIHIYIVCVCTVYIYIQYAQKNALWNTAINRHLDIVLNVCKGRDSIYRLCIHSSQFHSARNRDIKGFMYIYIWI